MLVLIDTEFLIDVDEDDDIEILKENLVFYKKTSDPLRVIIMEQKIALEECFIADIIEVFQRGVSTGIILRPYERNRYVLEVHK